MDERRHARRVATTLSVLVGEEGCVEVDRATLLSLSTTGAYIAMPVPPCSDRAVRVLLDKPDGSGRVTLRGKVVRVTADGVGLQFAPPDLETQIVVRRLVEEHPHLSGGHSAVVRDPLESTTPFPYQGGTPLTVTPLGILPTTPTPAATPPHPTPQRSTPAKVTPANVVPLRLQPTVTPAGGGATAPVGDGAKEPESRISRTLRKIFRR